ncbi:ATP-binding protein [Bifidobacterium amazonense]|uniref:ATP-binding protein n=1 Tax=Bifidobacterium amazonense TaxID=2809027 RepID=A0ABS9VX51_9BIFI|nr:ATP-binding protein [Bifidobacterium amazonense]MCH9276652.1 ATP-binding protein [Bifidobacterium amazonense]
MTKRGGQAAAGNTVLRVRAMPFSSRGSAMLRLRYRAISRQHSITRQRDSDTTGATTTHAKIRRADISAQSLSERPDRKAQISSARQETSSVLSEDTAQSSLKTDEDLIQSSSKTNEDGANMSLSSLIAEYLDFTIPSYITRDSASINVPKPARNNVIYTITGVRRCGKTYAMYQLMDKLIADGVPRDRLFHFSFDDERIMPFSDHTLSDLLDTYYRMVPQAVDGCYLLFDEIQEAPYWTHFIRRVAEQHNVTILLTGSSSKLLSSDIPTNLRGRSLSREMWPLSFAEYCQFHGISTQDVAGEYPAAVRRPLQNAFDDYLNVGGFPAVQTMTVLDRMRMLQGYADEIVIKDVLERFGTASLRVATRFSRNALRSTGLKFSVNAQIKTLRSMQVPVSGNKLYDLLDDFEDAHLLFKVGDFTFSIKDNPKASRKVYAVDPGLSLAVAPANHLDLGQRLETAVFVELKRRYGGNRSNAIASYSASNCPEVDFVVGDDATGEPYQLIQVAVETGIDATTVDDFGTAQLTDKFRSEIGNLSAAMANTGMDHGTLISINEEGTVTVTSGTIDVVPAWRWFLTKP